MGNKKRLIVGIVCGILALGILGVAFLAASVGGEVSKLDGMMQKDRDAHATFDEMKQELSGMGYSLAAVAADVNTTGPRHSVVVYATWLTLNLKFDADGKMRGYHIDRESSWF